ncbi:MAG: carboxypeptidase [bacterium]|nr:carboxypeptidase [bacterium]
MKLLRIMIVLSFVVLLFSTGAAGNSLTGKTAVGDETRFFRVYFDELDSAHKIVMSMNAIETRYENGYVTVEVSTGEEYRRLLDTGLKLEQIANPLSGKIMEMQEAAIYQKEAIPSYPCYRTVEETFASAEAMVAAYPALATWTDQGDSWEKANGFGGYDMNVLKLTNSAIAGPKPKLFLTGAIHAREYTTAELVTRFAEYLVDNYGTDADATWLLDHHELHVMLHANPDGRKKAETGLSWRKNTNQDYCSPTSNYRGADLNRNFAFKWDCCGGSSSSECDTTFHGAYAASEPETQAVQTYMMSLFPDQRGPNDSDAAPLDATGIYLDIHASGRLILWPWGWTSGPAPNAAGLQTFGRKMAYFNGHTPKQGYGLYPTDGTTKLFAYGELGIPGYTIELGTQFFQSCTYFENTLVPDNMPTLLYALKVVRTPYMTPSGPDAAGITLSAGSTPLGVPAGTVVTLNALIDDTRYNNSNGTEPSQDIAAAEYYIDTPPWVTSPVPVAVALSASDGSFNSTQEAVEGSIDTTGWSDETQHIIFVRGQDTDGNWGAFSGIFLYINNAGDTVPPTPNPMAWAAVPASAGPDSITMTAVTASDESGVEYYFDCLTTGGHDSGWQDGTTYVDTGLAAGTSYSYRVAARDKSANQNQTAWSELESASPFCDTPAAPSGLTANAVSCSQIDLSWTDNSGIETSFKIERSIDGVIFSQIDTVGAGVTAYNDTTAAEDSTYWYRVRASVSCGDSGYSNIASDTTPVCPVSPPAAPTNLKAKTRKTTVALTWNDNADNEDGFRIYRGDSPSTLVLIDTIGANATSYGDTGLTRKTFYYYKVCAYNTDGEGCSAIKGTKTK